MRDITKTEMFLNQIIDDLDALKGKMKLDNVSDDLMIELDAINLDLKLYVKKIEAGA